MKNRNYSFVSASTDAFREVRKYSVTEKVDLSNNPVAIEHIHMKLFRAQRNEYIAGFALLLCMWVFSPCLSHFLCCSLPQVSLVSVFCPPQHFSFWHWSFGTGFWTWSVTRHGLIAFWLTALRRFLDHACKQNFTRTLQTGSSGLAHSVPEECIYKKMHKLFHCNYVLYCSTHKNDQPSSK